MLALSLLVSALAAPPASPDRAAQDAEYRRLSAEVGRAAEKNNWVAVERHYQRALATGATLSAADHLRGAEAARTRGDLGLTRDRLVAALAVDPSQAQARQQVEALDSRFGRVHIKAWVGAKLEDYEHPFDPLALKAVDHGIATLARDGSFRGLLPPGPYSVDGDPFELAAGQEVVLDLSLGAPVPADPALSTLRR